MNVWNDEAQARGRQLLLALTRDLLTSSPSAPGLEGPAAIALFLAQAGRCLGDERLLDAASEQLEAAFGATEGDPGSLFFGLTGNAWVVAILDRTGILESDAELREMLDATLLVTAQVVPHYDCISGLVGLGLYFLERSRAGGVHQGLAVVLDQLERRAEHDAHGARWKTAPEWLTPHERNQAPNGYYNLGVAHGLAGVILLLAQYFAAGVELTRVQPLLESAVAQLRHHGGATGALRMWDAPGGECPESFGAAWCYGGLGAALALANAGHVLGRRDWLETAGAWALQSAELTSGIRDASLCHGTAGAALLLDALGQRTGHAHLSQQAARWTRSTLDFGNDPEGIGGFRTWQRLGVPPGWVRDAGLLSGAAGIGLFLLSRLFPDLDRYWAVPFVGEPHVRAPTAPFVSGGPDAEFQCP